MSDRKNIIAIPAAKPSKPSIQLKELITATTKRQVQSRLNSGDKEKIFC